MSIKYVRNVYGCREENYNTTNGEMNEIILPAPHNRTIHICSKHLATFTEALRILDSNAVYALNRWFETGATPTYTEDSDEE